MTKIPEFSAHLERAGQSLQADTITTLQVNLGKLCNQACKHCHVDASPTRTEIMSRETIDDIVGVLRRWRIPILDITGGAPELNPSFRHLVEQANSLGTHIIVRHNLTVVTVEGMETLPDFFRAHKVELVSSLPYFLAEQTDAQRGRGVFANSVEALQRLNEVGYGVAESGLILNLVYNPVGAFLPPSQQAIEADFKRELIKRYGISFNRLYVITNMPINRFLDYLRRSGNEVSYMEKLVAAFNPATVADLMCRDMISVSWTGHLFDCDFNQMLEIPLASPMKHIKDFAPLLLQYRPISTGQHCFGCTAGAGSSCSGAVVS